MKALLKNRNFQRWSPFILLLVILLLWQLVVVLFKVWRNVVVANGAYVWRVRKLLFVIVFVEPGFAPRG